MEYYGNLTGEVTEREIKNAALARRVARESFVLLKNEGILPLEAKKIALFGMGARKTISGGEGSGDASPRYKVSIEQGLENAGYEITSRTWLDDYDLEYRRTREEWRLMVEDRIKGEKNPIAQIPLAHSFKYRYPSGRLISMQDIRKSNTDTGIYVLMRQGGECNDRKNEAGDFQLTDTEISNIRILAENYSRSVLIINVGGLIDLSSIDGIPVGAIVFYVQGGMEGGNALADLLSGKYNFSGKLADTWPMKYEDIPGGNTFSYLNGNLSDEDYTEGRYVGYRYFQAFEIKPRYSFGFGLSYTTFSVSVFGVSCAGTKTEVLVKVRNTGSREGREVIQVYLQVPGYEYAALAAYQKTETIPAGEVREVRLSFELTDYGRIYDEKKSSWILPKGLYGVNVGTDAISAQTAAILETTEETLICKCRSCCAPEHKIREIAPGSLRAVQKYTDNVPVIRVDTSLVMAETADYSMLYHDPGQNKDADSLMQTLTEEEMLELLKGGDFQNNGPQQHLIPGAAGKTTIALRHRGIGNVLFADGPAGVNIIDEIFMEADGTQTTVRIPEKYQWGLMKQMAAQKQKKLAEDKNVQHVFRYATAWPVEELLAQSFDTALMMQIGEAVGEELKEFGITLWLAPGMNIHRNPLCGRNFEYYSEDPVLTGTLAAALTSGVQKQKGIGVTIKHFCCNNQEDNRIAVSANVSEKTLREIYLKGFEIAVKRAQPYAVMTSYNRLNGIYTGERKDLVTDILKCEWGYNGLVMTDWCTRYDPCTAINAGVDLLMPGGKEDSEKLLEGYHNGKLNKDRVQEAAFKVLEIIRMQ